MGRPASARSTDRNHQLRPALSRISLTGSENRDRDPYRVAPAKVGGHLEIPARGGYLVVRARGTRSFRQSVMSHGRGEKDTIQPSPGTTPTCGPERGDNSAVTRAGRGAKRVRRHQIAAPQARGAARSRRKARGAQRLAAAGCPRAGVGRVRTRKTITIRGRAPVHGARISHCRVPCVAGAGPGAQTAPGRVQARTKTGTSGGVAGEAEATVPLVEGNDERGIRRHKARPPDTRPLGAWPDSGPAKNGRRDRSAGDARRRCARTRSTPGRLCRDRGSSVEMRSNRVDASRAISRRRRRGGARDGGAAQRRAHSDEERPSSRHLTPCRVASRREGDGPSGTPGGGPGSRW